MKKLIIGILFAFIAVTYGHCGPYGNSPMTAEAMAIPTVKHELCAPASEQCPSDTSQIQCKKRGPAQESPCIIFCTEDSGEIELLCSKKLLGMPSSVPKQNVRLAIKNKNGKERVLLPCSWDDFSCSFKFDSMLYFHNDLLLQIRSGNKWAVLKKLN